MREVVPALDPPPTERWRSSTGRRRRFLIYSHGESGLESTGRHLAVAASLHPLAPDAEVLLATGAQEINRFHLPDRLEVFRLPALQNLEDPTPRLRHRRHNREETLRIRSALLRGVVDSFRPDVLLVDQDPLGLDGELQAALETLRAAQGRAALGLADFPNTAAPPRREWGHYDLQFCIAEFYDAVLIYGEQALFDPPREYGFSASLTARAHFCGYVASQALQEKPAASAWCKTRGDGRSLPFVVALSDGSEDGFHLLQTFIDASRGSAWRGLVFAGPLTPAWIGDRFQQRASAAGVLIQRSLPNLGRLLPAADALVCLGGYRTLVEALRCGVPTLCIPAVSSHPDQLPRVQAFARHGWIRWLHPQILNPPMLRDGIERLLRDRRSRPNAPPSNLRLNGAELAARQLIRLAPELAWRARLPEECTCA